MSEALPLAVGIGVSRVLPFTLVLGTVLAAPNLFVVERIPHAPGRGTQSSSILSEERQAARLRGVPQQHGSHDELQALVINRQQKTLRRKREKTACCQPREP
jgi:hypothetical protein